MPVISHRNGDVCVRRAKQRRRTITIITIVTAAPPSMMVVTMVMVTAYCYGRRAHTCPRRKGSFLAKNQCGGRQRSIAPPSDHKTRFAGFAVRAQWCVPAGGMPRQCWRARDVEEIGRCEPVCVPGSQVCTPNTQKGLQKLDTLSHAAMSSKKWRPPAARR
jgi:hypothetical protein